MIKPAVVSPTDEVTVIGEVFDTKLVVKQNTWLPLSQLVAWGVFTRMAKQRVAGRTWWESAGIGAVASTMVLASEWGHNLAHAYAAHRIGKPVNVIRIVLGMPLLVYFDINDQEVSPRQHIARAISGPIFNLTLLPIAILFRQGTKPNSVGRDIANAAVWVNWFIPTVGLLPIPGIDGGPILKWSLVERGHSIEEADNKVRIVNGVLGGIFTGASMLAFKKRGWLLGGFLATLALITVGVASGKLKEQAS